MTSKERTEDERFYREMAEEYTNEFWGVPLTCPIEFVNREWKSMTAFFAVNTETGKCRIVMSHKVNSRRGTGPSLDTLKHELAHWYLWNIGKPYSDDDLEFVRECLRIGASISGTKKAQKALEKVCAEIGVTIINE